VTRRPREGAEPSGGHASPAVFLDRDGTIIRDEHYLNDPGRVVLIDGAASAIGRLRAAGYLVVVVTNQSGIARGLVTPLQYEAVQTRVAAMLASAGTALDGTYVCPHHPDVGGVCACRKPAPGLYRQAAQEHGLDLSRSVLLGDRWRDIAAAPVLGARGILVPGPETPDSEVDRATVEADTAPTLGRAVDRILGP
jgi:histidinol-phosphate phosphatase family protein